MKKTILIGLLLTMVSVTQAQVTIWEKYYQTTYNQETYKYDTVAVLAYPTQFQKGEIDSITLLVSPKFTIEEKELQLRFGAQYALHYSIFPATEAITWTSGDPFVARVTDGVITAIGRGETTITGTTKDGTTQSVVVKCSEISIAINLPSTILRQGEGMQISATIDAGSEQARNCLWSWKPEDRATLYLGHTLYGNTCGPLTLTATADTTDAQGQYIWHNSAHLDVIAQDQTGVPPYSLLDSIRRKSGENMVLLCVHFDQQPCYGMQFVRYNYLTSKYGKLREVDAVRYPGWYYIIAGSSVKGTFVQESSIGRLNADYQTGDASTWQYVGGLQATFDSTDDCAAYFNFPKSGVYTYRSTAFTSNDCASLDTINYDEVQVCGEEYLEWYIIKFIAPGSGAIERINGINAYLSQQWVQDTIAWYNEKYGASIPTSLSVPTDTTTMVVIVEPMPRVTRDCHTERVPITNESKQANPRQVSNPETGEIDGKIQLWKNGQQVQWPYGYVYDHTISNLDSISLVRYSTKNIRMLYPGVDTVYLQNKAEGYTKVYSCPMLWEPYYSFDTLEFSLSNPNVINSPVVNIHPMSGRFIATYQLYSSYYNSHGTFSFIPAKAGQTDVTIRSGKAQTKKRIVVLEPDKKIYATADSLLQMIYNRMAITGSQMPDGDCDIPNIDEGTSSFYRLMWELNEFPADHVWWIWNDVGLADLRTHSWSTNNDLIRGLYARLYFNIDLCNQYLELTQSDASKKSERAEVRFMRAFYYSYLLDLFGNVPLITQHVLKDFPTQSTRKQVFQFVMEELEQAARDLPEPGYRATNYRADKAAAWLLLSRVYLNSEVYCGLSYMDKAAEYAYKVIKCPYKLSSNYQNLFMGDNNERYFNVGNDAVQEIILSIDQNPKTAYCWGGSRFLICALRNTSMPYCGVNDTWSCARSKTNLVEAFTTLEEAYSIQASNTATALGDDRAIFCSSYNDKNWNLRRDMASDFYACWAITKYTNLGASSSYTPGDENWPDMDIPIMRKAEAYLTYAEAVLRGGTVQSGYTALSAVNELRTRAHATLFETISLEELLNEWAREFYAEGRRRMDLIRFGAFSGQNTYNWEGKNGRNGTTATTIDAHYNLYPIPQNMINWNPNLTQNPGY